MNLLKRVGMYLLGVSLGVPIVLFFWNKKEVTFDYGMDARTLKTIRVRKRVYSKNALTTLQQNNIDTAMVSKLLREGDVSFKKSKPRQKPCAEYYVTGDLLDVYVIRCDSIATIDKVLVKNKN
ncbi:DUF4258 domain-containing protein [Tenacibaculum geojense]|uniref:DUF4258 domain-containing protein n=1 Tax=Tenacibaculum geojense TaxID=915352 RepID=A0ABW3JN51_9FLAO